MEASSLDKLYGRCAEIEDLGGASALLSWDQEVMMPRKGGPARAQQLATLAGLRHQLLTDPVVEEWLEECESASETESDDERRAALREIRREHERACRMPRELVRSLASAQSTAMDTWRSARSAHDFSVFAPQLDELLALVRQKAACLGDPARPYDALLDIYERASTEAQIDALFRGLRERLVPLLDRVLPVRHRVDPSCMRGDFDLQAQASFGRHVIEKLGFDLEAGRIDDSTHPFCSSMGLGDTRLTRRFESDDLRPALYGIIHEAGHGLYEQGLPARWSRHPLGDAVSLGVHESQSRLWENVIGRSRAFWRALQPQLKRSFPGRFEDVEVESLYRASNQVEASFIRVEADELTYNLHVILRFEVERRIFSGEVELAEVPRFWNQTSQELLGLTPEHDAQGCLQDIHWSLGAFGYFPTYTLGTLYASQIEAAVRRDHPDLDEFMERGDFSPLLQWLRTKIHAHGKRYSPAELIERATGSPPSPDPFLQYLEAKMADVYDL